MCEIIFYSVIFSSAGTLMGSLLFVTTVTLTITHALLV